jgi:hypothetical protein
MMVWVMGLNPVFLQALVVSSLLNGPVTAQECDATDVYQRS